MNPLQKAHIEALQLATSALESIIDPERGNTAGDPTPYAIANAALTGIRNILKRAIVEHQQNALSENEHSNARKQD
jgi:hypothetical protein